MIHATLVYDDGNLMEAHTDYHHRQEYIKIDQK